MSTPSRATASRQVVLVVLIALVAPIVAADRPSTAQPAPAEGGTADWRSVSAGAEHTCGIRTDRRLYCWGDDTYGQLGDDPVLADQATPVEVAGGFSDWGTVSAGDYQTCARRTTGRLYCWGDDDLGQLGDGAPATDQPTPVEVAGQHTTWTSVSTGGAHVCGRRSSGRLFCWGWDFFGQLGDGGTNTNRFAPSQVAGGHTTWTGVSAATGHTCARRSSGRLFCWGSDGNGRLGNGDPVAASAIPAQVSGGRTDWTSFATGAGHTCARRSSGALFCWGWDDSGQLGDGGDPTDATSPVRVTGGSTTWLSSTAGQYQSCARRSSGRLFCWGDDDKGQLGDDTTLADQAAPVEVDGSLTTWVAVDAGQSHTCARRSDARLFCWGDDGSGRLGDGGTETNQPTPVEVDG